MPCNWGDATRFMSALGGTHCAQTFGDVADNPAAHFPIEPDDDSLFKLQIYNDICGAGIFIVVNETDGEGRKAANVTRVRAVFVDLDGAPLENIDRFPLKPHFIIQTSPDRYHVYWLVGEGFPLDQFTMDQRRLAWTTGGDEFVSDLSRVMRLPGFCHLKDPDKPHLVRILEDRADELPRYDYTQILAALDEAGGGTPLKEDGEGGVEDDGRGIPERPIRSGRPPQAHEITYAKAALAGASADMAGAPDGQKWMEIRAKAYRMGGLAWTEAFDREEVVRALVDPVADRCRSVAKAEKTARQAFEAGKSKRLEILDRPPEKAHALPKDVGETLMGQIAPDKAVEAARRKVKRPPIITAAQLAEMQFNDPVEAVEGLLREGLAILAAKPKKGKSWLALALALSVSTGEPALGGQFKTIKGSVLYLALEDSQRRLQARLEALRGAAPKPEALHLATEWSRLDRDGLAALDQWLEETPDCKLVVIDTLARVKPNRSASADSYQHDAAVTAALQSLGLKHHACVLVVHHQRKMASEDVFDSISGTLGTTASADVVMVLERAPRSDCAKLTVTGRDIEEMALAMEFDAGCWRCTGDADVEAEADPLEAAMAFLREILKDGPMDSEEVFKRGKDAGFSRTRLFAAKKAIGFKSRKISVSDGWQWPQLPPLNSSKSFGQFEESRTLRDASVEESDSSGRSVRIVPKSFKTSGGEDLVNPAGSAEASRSVPKNPTLF